MPKISVIIPVYNVEKYLSKCLDSIINQTFSDIEIICVNDGSTDRSRKILETYKKTCENLEEQKRKSNEQLHRDLYHQNIMVRALAHEIQKYNQEFNFFKFEDELFGPSE